MRSSCRGASPPSCPALRGDDLYARVRGGQPEAFDAPSNDRAGEALESIEGDDPQLDASLLAKSAPPPIAVLSGSNDWDYASETGPDPAVPQRWHWDPLRGARLGGMGQLARAVRARMSPFLGFCGGAQLLGLLEAEPASHELSVDDEDLIDEVLSRATGKPIRGFAPPAECERAWPGDPRPARATVAFDPADPLFTDLAGAAGRSTTQELPLSHADAVRPDAFSPDGPLRRFEVLATSTFCAPEGVAAQARDALSANPKRARAGAAPCRRHSARETAHGPSSARSSTRSSATSPPRRPATRRSPSPIRGSFWRRRTSSSSTPVCGSRRERRRVLSTTPCDLSGSPRILAALSLDAACAPPPAPVTPVAVEAPSGSAASTRDPSYPSVRRRRSRAPPRRPWRARHRPDRRRLRRTATGFPGGPRRRDQGNRRRRFGRRRQAHRAAAVMAGDDAHLAFLVARLRATRFVYTGDFEHAAAALVAVIPCSPGIPNCPTSSGRTTR